MGLFSKKEITKEELKEVEMQIYSASHYQKEIENVISRVMSINNRYIMETYLKDDTNIVWKYDTCHIKKVLFENEPKNKYDPHAIKILVGDGALVPTTIGYIPQEDNKKIKKWIDNKQIYNINLKIYGGDKKYISKDNVMHDKTNYKVTLNVLIKK